MMFGVPNNVVEPRTTIQQYLMFEDQISKLLRTSQGIVGVTSKQVIPCDSTADCAPDERCESGECVYVGLR